MKKKQNWVFLIILAAFLLLFIALLLVPMPTVKDMFNNTSNNPDVGGILIHMMESSDFNDIVKKDNIQFSKMGDCAIYNRHTCSAWTLLRRDLPPMPFVFPGPISPNVGVLINPAEMWDYITTMAVVDSNTNNRSCCTNESGSNVILKWPASYKTPTCFDRVLERKYPDHRYDEWVVYISSVNHGSGCPLICDPDDEYCQYNNSGGGINTWIMNEDQQCFDGKYDECYVFNKIDEQSVPDDVKNSPVIKAKNKPIGYLVQSYSKDCPFCTKPYLCVTEKSPDGKNTMMRNEKDILATYVGSNGDDWSEVFLKDDAFGDALETGRISGLQCKFQKKDWGAWVHAMKEYYKKTLTVMQPNNSMNTQYNYLLANCNAGSYIENEVNMYINPDIKSNMYKKQQKSFINAIVGFVYVSTDCETQMKPLEGIQSTVGDTATLSGTVDRCDCFFNTTGNPGYQPVTGQKRRNYEQQRINEGKEAVINIVNWFNTTYSKNVSGYAATFNSNSFPNYKRYNQSLSGDISFDSVLKKIV